MAYMWRTACLIVDADMHERCEAVAELVDPNEVAGLAREIRRWWLVQGQSMPERVARFLRESLRTGRLVYCPDPPLYDRWCSPLTTIQRGCGDCDDLAIVTLSLLLALGVNAYAAIGAYHKPDGTVEWHMWVEGWRDGQFFLIEPTTGKIYTCRPNRYVPEQLAWTDGCVAV